MVNFMIYDLVFLAAFTLFVIIFLYKRRKKLDREGLLYLYRTKFGLKIINYVGENYRKTLKFFSYVVVVTGYILMVVILYLFVQIVYIYYKFPEIVQAVKVPPIMPLVPYLPELFKISFLPPFYFTYWIIIIAIVAIFHEFAHGIFARFYNIKVKSTGFGFLGPFLAAFVEPDEKQMQKKKIFPQLAILTSGTFANLLTAIFFLIVIWIYFSLAFVPSGVIFNTYSYTAIDVMDINQINNISLNNVSINETYSIFKRIFEKENQTKIMANNYSYIVYKDMIESQKGNEFIIAYHDAPAINQKIEGAIIEINGTKINSRENLAKEMMKYSPGQEINIKTSLGEDETKEYKIILVKNPEDETKPFIGIGFSTPQGKRIIGKIYSLFSSFKDPQIYYQPKINGLSIFIYNLLWWLILICLSVALVNMLPLGIFDGGRVFFLTIFGITKSERIAKLSFKFMTYLLLLIILLLMVFWAFSFF